MATQTHTHKGTSKIITSFLKRETTSCPIFEAEVVVFFFFYLYLAGENLNDGIHCPDRTGSNRDPWRVWASAESSPVTKCVDTASLCPGSSHDRG